MKIQDIISKAKKLDSYKKNLNKTFTEKQRTRALISSSKAIEECKQCSGKKNEEDSYNPFDKLARLLGRYNSTK